MRSKLTFHIITFLCFALFSVSSEAQQNAKKPAKISVPLWKTIETDLEQTQVSFIRDSLFEIDVTFVRTSLSNFQLRVLSSTENSSFRAQAKCQANNATLCINANFFDEQQRALGLVISQKQVLQKIHKGGKLLNGIFSIINNKPRILNRSEQLSPETQEAIQSGPILIKSRKKVSALPNISAESNRAGVCIDSKDRLVFFCSSATFGGLTLPELQELLLSKGIDCVDALNFDGGGSAQLYVQTNKNGTSNKKNGKTIKEQVISIHGRDSVPVMLALLPRK